MWELVSAVREVKTSVSGGKNICRATVGDESGKGARGPVLYRQTCSLPHLIKGTPFF